MWVRGWQGQGFLAQLGVRLDWGVTAVSGICQFSRFPGSSPSYLHIALSWRPTQQRTHSHHQPANSLKHIEPPTLPELFLIPLQYLYTLEFILQSSPLPKINKKKGRKRYSSFLRRYSVDLEETRTLSLLNSLVRKHSLFPAKKGHTKTGSHRPNSLLHQATNSYREYPERKEKKRTAMSLAVGQQTLRPSSSAVEHHPESESSNSHTVEPFNIGPVPSSHARPAAGDHDLSSATAVHPSSDLSNNRDSYDSIHRQYYEAMVDQSIIASKAEVSERDQRAMDADETAPVLPQKSALRASRLLDGLVGLKVAASTPNFTQTPHDEYLSSEEEASSTAGDFSDLEYDSSSDDISPSPVKAATAQEVTARVVSVIFSGKPMVVNVPQARRSISPNSIERPKSANELGMDRSASPCGSEAKSRRTSVSTVSSRISRSTSTTTHPTTKPKIPHPPRSSSMQPLGTKPKPFFLKIDPYANGSTYSLDNTSRVSLHHPQQPHPQPQQEEQQQDSKPVEAPKTPTRMFKGVARAMSLMRRRSMPRLSQAHLSPSNEHLPTPRSPSNGSIPEETIENSVEDEAAPLQQQITAPEQVSTPIAESHTVPPQPTRPPPQPLVQQPLTHDGIVRMAAMNERKQQQQQQQQYLAVSRTFHEGQGQTLDSPVSPMSPMSAISAHSTQSGKRMSSFGFGRRRMSVKLTGGKFQL